MSDARVLVVDDESVIHIAIEAILEASLHSVMSVREALEFEGLDEIDIVLVDKNLPDGSGLDVIRELKKRAPDLEFLIITGYPSLKSAIEAVETGAFDYLPKPFETDELLLKVRNGIEKTRLTRQQRALHLKLKESEDRHRAIFDASADAIVVVNESSGQIVAANRAAELLYGYEDSELVGLSAASLVVHDTPDLNGRTIHRHRNGAEFSVEVSRSETRMSGEEARIEIVRDVSDRVLEEEERRLASKRQRKSEKMDVLGQLSAGIAHDFNNLLMVFMGVSSEFELYFEDPAVVTLTDVKEAADELDTAIRSAMQLTRQLLGFSRRQLVCVENIDVGKVVESIVQLLRRTIEEKVSLSVSVAGDLPLVCMDRGQLEQLMTNLILNARDAMPSGGNVKVSVAKCVDALGEPTVVICVQDTGSGIPPEVLEDIFEPFFTTKGPERGTGLGLATVLSIVNNYDGEIVVDSVVGKGTLFSIAFPASVGNKELAESAEGDVVPVENSGQGVLLVEDDNRVRTAIERVLLRAGYSVTSASTSEEALILAKGDSFDLLLTDIGLPLMQGDELAQLFKQQSTARILLMSGYAVDAKSIHTERTGDVAFIAKPFDTERLLSRVRAVLD
ncbi:MAG: response regulator [Kofleriaceae bacterium]|nr:response regulator [Kofleriaceae bacterium]